MPETWIIVAVVLAGAAIGLVAGFYLLVPRTDPKLEALRRRDVVEPTRGETNADSTDAAKREAAALMKQGKKIEAIKVYREKTGVGLAEAKAAVERL
jgi:ribosomal protein L7/L12